MVKMLSGVKPDSGPRATSTTSNYSPTPPCKAASQVPSVRCDSLRLRGGTLLALCGGGCVLLS